MTTDTVKSSKPIKQAPLVSLRDKLVEDYGHLYLAANDLGISQNKLSRLINGALDFTEEQISLFEGVLGMDRTQFLPPGYTPRVLGKPGRPRKHKR